MKTGLRRITDERQRQIAALGYDEAQEDEHTRGELACAAAVYATPPMQRNDNEIAAQLWPDDWQRKDCDRIRELTIAGAFIVAEIDRLQRVQALYESDPELAQAEADEAEAGH